MRKRKYNINDDYFEKIDTEPKAYILGLMYADGCVYSSKGQTKRAKIDLKSDDKYLLEEIAKEMNNENPIRTNTYYRKEYFSNQDKTYEFVHDMSRLWMNSNKIVDDLINAGCMSKKTYDLKFPTAKIVPDNLINHFIRGYFDGDGCISYSARKSNHGERLHFSITFTGTYDLVSGIKRLLNENCCNFVGDIRSRYNNGVNNYTLTICGNDILLKICKYMYENSTIKLNRKYDKYNLLIDEIKRRENNPYAYNKKQFELYKDGIYIDTFESAKFLEKISEERFGVKLSRPQISMCLNGKYSKTNVYKGFTFKLIT